ncbi:hypothetical protein GIB67_004528 [Kingdonia uniflora]|uniref:Uncharacterized protein n=1 Tax=Kingdonia uniflora TaxID=39325 RepID=A0A7J7ML55_9MAGN|nr:hypothetical protein GIB67_004528 [Kingdonia uniflora]
MKTIRSSTSTTNHPSATNSQGDTTLPHRIQHFKQPPTTTIVLKDQASRTQSTPKLVLRPIKRITGKRTSSESKTMSY